MFSTAHKQMQDSTKQEKILKCDSDLTGANLI